MWSTNEWMVDEKPAPNLKCVWMRRRRVNGIVCVPWLAVVGLAKSKETGIAGRGGEVQY